MVSLSFKAKTLNYIKNKEFCLKKASTRDQTIRVFLISTQFLKI